jgi:hypothetical protein
VTTSYSALAAVSAGIYTALNVAALTALAPGGVGDDVAQASGYPFVLFDVNETVQGGLGTKAGSVGVVIEVAIRLHVFSQFEGYSEAHAVVAKAIELLADPPAVTGFASVAIFHDETITVGDELVAGVKVKELVALCRLYVETV